MKTRTRTLLPALFASLLCTASVSPAAGEAAAHPIEASLAEALPSGAFVFAETSGLRELIGSIRDSEALKKIFASDQYTEFETSEEFEKTDNGRQLAEFVLRMDLWEAGQKLFGGRIGAALYPKKGSKQPDFVLVLQPADPEAWSKQRLWTDPLLALSSKRQERFRWGWGLKVYQTKGVKGAPAFVALHKEWIAFATNMDLLEKTISLQVDNPVDLKRMKIRTATPLAKDPRFRKMLAKAGPDDHLARAFVDTAMISKGAGGRLGLPVKMDNPVGSLLVGGILELAANSTFAAITLDTDKDGFVLEAALDGDPKKLEERFQVFFSDFPESGTTDIPEVPGLIGGFTLYRDIATWYRSRDALLQDKVLPQFDKFEAGVGNLLPGKDMGEDVLPLLGNNATFVSALQDYDHVEGEPGVKLPAFALIVDLDEADEATDIFQLFFQTLLSVLNFEAGEQNRQPWLIDMKMHGDVKVTTARYLEKPEGDRLPIVFNFLPASARVGNKYIVSTSLELCTNLIDAVKAPGHVKLRDQNLGFNLRVQPLATILEANADHFEAKRIIEGRTAKQAKADVALALTLLRQLDTLSASTSATADGFRLQLKGTLKGAN